MSIGPKKKAHLSSTHLPSTRFHACMLYCLSKHSRKDKLYALNRWNSDTCSPRISCNINPPTGRWIRRLRHQCHRRVCTSSSSQRYGPRWHTTGMRENVGGCLICCRITNTRKSTGSSDSCLTYAQSSNIKAQTHQFFSKDLPKRSCGNVQVLQCVHFCVNARLHTKKYHENHAHTHLWIFYLNIRDFMTALNRSDRSALRVMVCFFVCACMYMTRMMCVTRGASR